MSNWNNVTFAVEKDLMQELTSDENQELDGAEDLNDFLNAAHENWIRNEGCEDEYFVFSVELNGYYSASVFTELFNGFLEALEGGSDPTEDLIGVDGYRHAVKQEEDDGNGGIYTNFDGDSHLFLFENPETIIEEIKSEPVVKLVFGTSEKHFKAASKRMQKFLSDTTGEKVKLGTAQQGLSHVLYTIPFQEVKAVYLDEKDFDIKYSVLLNESDTDIPEWSEFNYQITIKATSEEDALRKLNEKYSVNSKEILLKVISVNSVEVFGNSEKQSLILDTAVLNGDNRVFYPNEYKMIGSTAWIKAGSLSLCIQMNDEGVSVDIYPAVNNEEDPINTIYEFFNE